MTPGTQLRHVATQTVCVVLGNVGSGYVEIQELLSGKKRQVHVDALNDAKRYEIVRMERQEGLDL